MCFFSFNLKIFICFFILVFKLRLFSILVLNVCAIHSLKLPFQFLLRVKKWISHASNLFFLGLLRFFPVRILYLFCETQKLSCFEIFFTKVGVSILIFSHWLISFLSTQTVQILEFWVNFAFKAPKNAFVASKSSFGVEFSVIFGTFWVFLLFKAPISTFLTQIHVDAKFHFIGTISTPHRHCSFSIGLFLNAHWIFHDVKKDSEVAVKKLTYGWVIWIL